MVEDEAVDDGIEQADVLCLVCACNAIHSHCPCSHGNHCVSTIIFSQHQSAKT